MLARRPIAEGLTSLQQIVDLVFDHAGWKGAALSFIDEKTETITYRRGFDVAELPIALSLAAHAGKSSPTIEIENTLGDSRFAANPLVQGGPMIRRFSACYISTAEHLQDACLWIWDDRTEGGGSNLSSLASFASLAASALSEASSSLSGASSDSSSEQFTQTLEELTLPDKAPKSLSSLLSQGASVMEGWNLTVWRSSAEERFVPAVASDPDGLNQGSRAEHHFATSDCEMTARLADLGTGTNGYLVASHSLNFQGVRDELKSDTYLYLQSLATLASSQLLIAQIKESEELTQARNAEQSISEEGLLTYYPRKSPNLHANSSFLKIWNVSSRELDASDERTLFSALGDQIRDPDQFLSKIDSFVAHPSEGLDERLVLRDGRHFRCHTAGSKQNGSTDSETVRVWKFTDITREAKLKDTVQKTLATTSSKGSKEKKTEDWISDAISSLGFDYGAILRIETNADSSMSIEMLSSWNGRTEAPLEDAPFPAQFYRDALSQDGIARFGASHLNAYGKDQVASHLNIVDTFVIPLRNWTKRNRLCLALYHSEALPPVDDWQKAQMALFATAANTTVVKDLGSQRQETSRTFFQQIIEASPNPILIKDRDGRYLMANQSLAQLYGVAKEELIGATDSLLCKNPKDAEKFRADDEEVLRTLEPKIIASESITDQSGNRRWLSTHKRPIVSEDGIAEHLLVICTDITERREAEKALDWQLAKATLLNQITRDIRSSLDLEQVFQTTVTAIGKTFDASRVHLHAYTGGSEPDIPLVAKYMEGRVNSIIGIEIPFKGNAHVEKVISHDGAIPTSDVDDDPLLDGTRHLLRSLGVKSMLAVRTSYRGRPNGIIMVQQCNDNRDWSPEEIELIEAIANQVGIAMAQADLMGRERERRRELASKNGDLIDAKQEAEVASLAKSEFLARMSHELRTPLNAILGFTQLLNMDSQITPEQQETLSIINKSGEQLLELINDVLQVSRIESGQVTLNTKAFDLDQLLSSQVAMFRVRAEPIGLSLNFEAAQSLPQEIITDPGKIRQVVSNLLSNALKFTTEGKITLRARTVEAGATSGLPRRVGSTAPPPTRSCLVIDVEDTGPGIPETELETIFERFAQTDIGREAQQGSGLGLAICRQFVELLGGEIVASSEQGVGSTFSFFVQYDSITGSIPELEMAPEEHSGPPVGILGGGSQRILVVDDQAASRSFLVPVLEQAGFEVAEAEDGKEALSFFRSWSPSAVIMDLQMPEMDGYEATTLIRREFGGGSIPIVAVSASAFEDTQQRALDAGCNAFISKPFKIENLFSVLQHALEIEFLYESKRLTPPTEEEVPSVISVDTRTNPPKPETSSLAKLSSPQKRQQLRTSSDLQPLQLIPESVMNDLPQGWLDQLEESAIQLDLEKIEASLSQLESKAPGSTVSLEASVAEFNYEPILALVRRTREASTNSPHA